MARIYVLSGDDVGAVREAASGAVIGRARDTDVPVRGGSISRRHARLEERGGRWFVVDLGSSNGTRVGGRVVEEAELADGEEFLLGDVEVRFRVGVAAAPPTPVAADLDLATRRAETTFLPSEPGAPAEPSEEEVGSFELEGDWDESVPAPAPPAPVRAARTRPAQDPTPAPTPAPAPGPKAPLDKTAADAARRRAEAMGGPVGGARATTSGGRILQYQRVENRSGLFGVDLAQLPAATRFALYALVLVVVAALAWGAYQLTATTKRASASSSFEEPFEER